MHFALRKDECCVRSRYLVFKHTSGLSPAVLTIIKGRKSFWYSIIIIIGTWGSVVVKALGYWDGPGIDPRWCHLGFFPWLLLTKPCALRSTQSLKNEYQGFILG